MPKTLITEAQRREEEYHKRCLMVGDRLTVYMKRHKITNEVLSDCFGFNGRGNATVGRAKIGKLIQGENVTLPLHAVWKILDLAGIELKKKEGWTV